MSATSANPGLHPQRHVLTLAALIGLALPGCDRAIVAQQPALPAAAEAKPPADGVAKVTAGSPMRKALKRTTIQPARLQSFEETPLFSKITGYVEEVLVDIGDRVKKDQVLVKLWVPEMRDDLRQKEAMLRQAEAEVLQARAAIRAAEAAVESAMFRIREAEAGVGRAEGDLQRWKAETSRIQELVAGGSVTRKLADETLQQLRAAEAGRQETQARIDSAKAALAQTQAQLESVKVDELAAQARQGVAESNVARAKTMLAYAEIRATYDGMVTRRHVDAGHYVQPASGVDAKPLLVICSAGVVRVFVDVPEMEAPLVNAGDPVQVQMQSLGGKEFPGKVTRTSWDLDPANRSLRTEIDLPNEQGELRPGMYATATILLDERTDALVLPISAIVREGHAAFCSQVVNGQIRRTPVTLGLRSGNEVEIAAGLTGQETVVLQRADSVKDGQAVELLPAQP